jgi:hypothetical protein
VIIKLFLVFGIYVLVHCIKEFLWAITTPHPTVRAHGVANRAGECLGVVVFFFFGGGGGVDFLGLKDQNPKK